MSSSFVELVRRSINVNLATAAAAAFVVTSLYIDDSEIKRKKDPLSRNNNITSSITLTRCEVHAQHETNGSSIPFQRLSKRVNERPSLTEQTSILSRMKIDNRAKGMNLKYIIDWKTVLGEGAYGRVFPARHRTTGEKVALKKISKRYTNSASFRSETDALLRIYDNGGHPNISGLRDMFEDFDHYYLILDLVPGGEMFDHLIKYGQYSEDDASRLVQEILSALAFLHNIGVVHADLKPENILLCSKKKGAETVKIIDFGCAVVDKRGGYNNSSIVHSEPFNPLLNDTPQTASTGTKAYWAPECFRDVTITESMDMWAVGVIVYIMLVGVHPFDVKGMASDKEIEEAIQQNPIPPLTPALTSHLSPSARDFIKSLMNADTDTRLTALVALQHPWIRGERTPTSKIIGSDYKLSMYQDLREKLATGIFAALVDGKNIKTEQAANSEQSETTSCTHILTRAFEVFDEQGKGYVNEADLGRVITKVTGSNLSLKDQKDMMTVAKTSSSLESTSGLSLSDFSQLFSRLSHQHFPRGHFIYQVGDVGDAMYFINSGKVEILTRKGHLVSILRHGDFFGEGSLLEARNHRFTSAKCSTPVDVIKVSREEFARYIQSASETKASLKLKYKARSLEQAKQLIRLQTNLAKRKLIRGEDSKAKFVSTKNFHPYFPNFHHLHWKKGQAVYSEGDIGESMFLVDSGNFRVEHGGKVEHILCPGDTFGESSLLLRRPRSSTVTCDSVECHLHEMHSSDFFEMLESDPTTNNALREMSLQRMFQKAVKGYLRSQSHTEAGFGEDALKTLFHAADTDKSGSLSLDEVRGIMGTGANSSLKETEILELLNSLDIDEDGQVSLEDFLRVVKSMK